MGSSLVSVMVPNLDSLVLHFHRSWPAAAAQFQLCEEVTSLSVPFCRWRRESQIFLKIISNLPFVHT
jgi:hypothetical protein